MVWQRPPSGGPIDESGKADGDHQLRERKERNPGARWLEPAQRGPAGRRGALSGD